MTDSTAFSDVETQNLGRSGDGNSSTAARISSRFQVSAHRSRGNAENAVGDCSGGVAVVIPQHSTESLATRDLASDRTDFFTRIDQLIAEPLMIPLGVIMSEEFGDSAAQ
jgi:hypothetical protein